MEQKKQRHLIKERLEALVAEVENHQYIWRRITKLVTPTQDAPKAHTPSDLSARTCEEGPVIRKVAPESSGLASFNEDLREEINTTNLKDCVPKAHHPYLNIFSEQ